MRKFVRIGFALSLAVSSILATSCLALTFKDFDSTHWAYTDVMRLVENGVLQGFPDGDFKPEENVTREQFVKILVETLKPAGLSVFDIEDVPQDRWSRGYIEIGVQFMDCIEENGKMYFKPEDAAKREDVAIAIIKAFGLDVSKANLDLLENFEDKDSISENAKPYVALAVEKGLMQGKGDTFDPQAGLKRCEIARLFCNVEDKREEILNVHEEEIKPVEPPIEPPVEEPIDEPPVEETETKYERSYGVVKDIVYNSVNEKYEIKIETIDGKEKLFTFDDNLIDEQDVIRYTVRKNGKIGLGLVLDISQITQNTEVKEVDDTGRMYKCVLAALPDDLDDEYYTDRYTENPTLIVSLGVDEDGDLEVTNIEQKNYYDIKLKKKDFVCFNLDENVMCIVKMSNALYNEKDTYFGVQR